MKKVITLLLALLMCVGLVSCGGGASEEPEEAAKPTPAELIQVLKDSDAEEGERAYGMMIGETVEVIQNDIHHHITNIVDVTEPEIVCGKIAMAYDDETILIEAYTAYGILDVQRYSLALLKAFGLSESSLLRVEEDMFVLSDNKGRGIVLEGCLIYTQQSYDPNQEDAHLYFQLSVLIKPNEASDNYVEGELMVTES